MRRGRILAGALGFLHGSAATTAVEFGIVAPLLFAIMFGLIGFGTQFATRIALTHPITGRQLVIEAPLPLDLQELLTASDLSVHPAQGVRTIVTSKRAAGGTVESQGRRYSR